MNQALWWCYDVALLLGFLFFYIPASVLRGKYHRGMWSRLGRVPDAPADQPVLWLHAVSVGEAQVARAIYEQFKRQYPQWRCVVSTVTPTGRQVAASFLQAGDRHCFLPLDIGCLMRGAMRRLHPRLIIMIETELWPNWLRAAQQAQVPVALVNGRISDRSFRQHRRYGWTLRAVLPAITRCLAQTSLDARRFATMGIPPERITVAGNVKFDMALAHCVTPAEIESIRRRCGFDADSAVLIGGSTHAGEETALLQSYRALKEELPSLRLIMAPRHPERCDAVAALIERAGHPVARWSRLAAQAVRSDGAPVVLVDTIGDLSRIYGVASVVFMGGSLIPHGGQNPLEPAILCKPVVMGPHYANFRSIVEPLLQAQACRVARAPDALTGILREILMDASLRESMGQAAGLVVKANTGALLRTAQAINEIISSIPRR